MKSRVCLMQIFKIILLLFLFSCKNNTIEPDDKGKENDIKEISPSEVEVIVAKKQDFDNEVVSNGKLFAYNKTEIRFLLGEMVIKTNVHNGQIVKKGDTLAIQNNFEIKNHLKQIKIQFAKSKLDLADLLLGQGYDLKDTANMDKTLLETVMIKSGYSKVQSELELAEYKFKSSFLIAPTTGLVANLFIKDKNYVKSGELLCQIIDNSKFEILFPAMESEIGFIKTQQNVLIIPFSNEAYEVNGSVTEINPIVDNNGLITIKAVVNDRYHRFYEGMNVKVFLKSSVNNKIVVPKEAITMRSDKPVVFTYKNGLAQWNYIKTGAENHSSIIVEEGIKELDTVIYKGNVSLGHNTKVNPINISSIRK